MSQENEDSNSVRLAKLIASRGVASRREAEAMIAEGRVTVNGQVVLKPVGVDPKDHIKVDGRALPTPPPTVWFVLYKPKGYITGREDPEGRNSVMELVEHLQIRMEPVGRLDFDTEGALLFTNDGETAHKLAHPSTEVPKRYHAKVYRKPGPEKLEAIRTGKVYLEDGPVPPSKVRVIASTDTENSWVEITVTEGRNRLVRRLFASLGHPVAKLRRESFATIALRDLELGAMRMLTVDEISRLRELVEGVAPQEAGKKARGSKVGFAKPDPEWIEKRTRKARRMKARAGKTQRAPRIGKVNNPGKA